MRHTARRSAVAFEPKSAVFPPIPRSDEPRLRAAAKAAAESRETDAWTLALTPAEQRFLVEDLAELTDRERQVVFALCEGGQNQAVADRLFIALPTLRTHMMRINQKLGARSKGDVVRYIASRLLDRYRSGRPVLGLVTSDNTIMRQPREGEDERA